MADQKLLSKYFDISVRQQLETQFKTSPHDKFFVFSTLPTFTGLSSSPVGENIMCPLMFANTFTASDPRIPGGQIGSLGTSKVIQINSPGGGQKTFQIGSFAVITGDPNGGDSGAMKWTMAKKLFYPLIKGAISGDGTCKTLMNPFLMKNLDNVETDPVDSPYKIIGYDVNDIFTNFGESEFYDIPFGLLVITLTKGNDFVSARMLEMCKLGDQGPMIQAMLNSPSIVAGAQGVTGTYANERPIPIEEIQSRFTLGTSESTFLGALFKYCGFNEGQK